MISQKPTVEFDPENPEHVASIKAMIDNARRDSPLRFHLGVDEEVDGKFTSVMSKAIFAMAYRYMEDMVGQTGVSTDAESKGNLVGRNVVRQLPVRQPSQSTNTPVIGLPGQIKKDLSSKSEAKKLH